MRLYSTVSCFGCGCQYQLETRRVTYANKNNNNLFCSHVCSSYYRSKKAKLQCKECGVGVIRQQKNLNRNKNTFCSRRCCALYYNKNKIGGDSRSKLELWIESQLVTLYPNLTFSFNDRSIGLEFDIYIPEYRLAFELNGIFHYEPIFGIERLNEIQNNDIRKFKYCHENGISLCVIDTSSQGKFTEKSSQKYLDIITKIISERMGCRSNL